MEIWNKLSKPPLTALKPIQAGRLRGKSDINPQWRYQAMTEVFGMCGFGWKYTIDKLWTELGSQDQVFVFALVSVYVKQGDIWSEPIPAVGGSMLIQKESSGLYSNDEGFKMAVTDALGTAMKMLGVAAEVYLGNFDGSKYRDDLSEPIGKPEANQDHIRKCEEALKKATTLEELKKAWFELTVSPAYLSLARTDKDAVEKLRQFKDELKAKFLQEA